MKGIYLYTLLAIITLFASCNQANQKAQVSKDKIKLDSIQKEKQEIIVMITQFYKEYDFIWKINDSLSYDFLLKQSDTLFKMYCTPDFSNKAIGYLKADGGHSLVTNDYYGEIDFKSFVVTSQDNRNELFKVSCIMSDSSMSGAPWSEKVEFKVKVIKDINGYKIDEIL